MDFTSISTLIFDFGGVLINLKREAAIEAFRQLGLDTADQLLDNYVQSGIFMQLENGSLSAADFRDEVRKLTAPTVTDEQIDQALYAFLLDRLSLSQRNHWFDEYGRVYLIFTREEVQNKLCLSEK